jgi:predicted phosphodiesterase
MNFERDYKRVFILSDAHIHGYETKKDKSAFEILKDRLQWCDLAIAAGDFLERHALPWEKLKESPWGELFPQMRKKLILLFGNHDKKEDYADIPRFWLSSGKEFRFTSSRVPFVVTHGDQFDSAAWIDQFMGYKIVRKLMPRIKQVETWLLGHDAKAGRLGRYYKQWNNEQKVGFRALKKSNDEWGIAGHTHIPEIDNVERYINAGEFPYTFIEVSNGAPRPQFNRV